MICPGCQTGFCQTVGPMLIAGGIGLVMVAFMTRAVRLWFMRQVESLAGKVIDRLWKR